MRKLFFLLFMVVFAYNISVASNANVSALLDSLHLPPTTRVAAENLHLTVFMNVDGEYDDEVPVVTLWAYWPEKGELRKLLTTNPEENRECHDFRSKPQIVPLSSIPTVRNVYINGEEDKILVDGNDERNCYSYIISLTDDSPAIQLPCNAGILGLSSEEDFPIGQSYAYRRHGGRYSVISIFDWEGNCLKRLSLNN